MKPRAAHRIRRQILLGCLPVSSSRTLAVLVLAVAAFAARYIPSYGSDVPPDQSVTLSPIPAQQTDEPTTITSAASGNNTLAFSLTNPPDGASIDPRTGHFSRMLVVTDGRLDLIAVMADDGAGGSDFLAIEIEVASGVSESSSTGGADLRSVNSNRPLGMGSISPFRRHIAECDALSFTVRATGAGGDTVSLELGDKPTGVGNDPSISDTASYAFLGTTNARATVSWETAHGGAGNTVGEHPFQVIATDDRGATDWAGTRVLVWAALPAFSAPTGTQAATVGEELTVQVTASNGACGDDTIRYHMYILRNSATGQAGMGAELRHYADQHIPPCNSCVDRAAGVSTWTPTRAGLYHVVVSATDGHGRSNRKVFHVDVDTPPMPPTADAGPDQTVRTGRTVYLDGTGSFDPDGYSLTYSWSQILGRTVTLSDSTRPTPSFTAPSSSATLVFGLTVTDDDSPPLSDTVTITDAPPPNRPTTADAGPDLTVIEGDPVTLPGTASDPDGDHLTYLWTHDRTDLPVILESATTLSTIFAAPSIDPDATVTFTLTADDGRGASSSDTVTITILVEGSPPDAPQNLWFGATTDATLTLIWDDPGDATNTGYKTLSGAPATQTHLSTLINNTGSAETACTVRDLEPDITCVFRAVAINEHGDSDRSNYVGISTPP